MTSLRDAVGLVHRRRYVSMRVHGTSAHVEPDLESEHGEHIRVRRRPEGTSITSTVPTGVSVHLAIPSPLQVDRTEFVRPLSPAGEEPAFAGALIRLRRVQIFLDPVRGVQLGTFRVMDGRHQVAHGQMDTLNMLTSTSDTLWEDTASQPFPYTCTLDKRLNLGLGFTFEVQFNGAAFGPEPAELLLVGAKAYFTS